MIKNISLDFPEFGEGININLDFTPGINLIEQDNGWGKTTMINTIHSFFTGKFPGLRKLPNGNASIEFSNKQKGLLKKNSWVGSPTQNSLYDYIIPGKFFNLNTVQQRDAFIKMLKLDDEAFIKKIIPYYYTDIEADLNAKKKDYLSKEEILLEDIKQLKLFLRDLDAIDFSDVEKYLKDVELLKSAVESYNKENLIHIKDNHKLETQIEFYNSTLESLKGKTIGTVCNSCGNSLTEEQIKIATDKHQELINNTELEIQKIKDLSDKTIQLEEIILSKENELEVSKTFLIDLVPVTEERLKAYYDYNQESKLIEARKQDLLQKETLLKTFNTIGIDSQLEEIKKAKVDFTKYLEAILKTLPFKIELFEYYQNGNSKPSFKIYKDGIEYSNLSTGNKNLVEIQVAKIFVSNLGLDFMLIDEASNISKSNLEYIKELSKDLQIIMARPTLWELKDLK